MKRTFLLTISLFARLFLVAQTQYDYMDDDAVAGGADRVLNWILVITGLIILGIIIMIFIGFALKIYYWFNPQADYKWKSIKERNREEKDILLNEERNRKKTIVDLGLSVMWADSNIFAKSQSDKGEKFAWGDITKRTSFRIIDCPLNKKTPRDLKEILGNEDMSICGIKEYDVATSLWGESWRLPQMYEIKELINKCEWKWTSIDGVNGYLIIGKNSNSIFLPVTGEVVGNETKSIEMGYYWTGIASSDPYEAKFLFFNSVEKSAQSAGLRWHRMAIRPVWSPKKKSIEEILNQLELEKSIQIKDNNLLYTIYRESFALTTNPESNDVIHDLNIRKMYSSDGRQLLSIWNGTGGKNEKIDLNPRVGTQIICDGAYDDYNNNCEDVILIPDTVFAIGYKAFMFFNSYSLTIPPSVKYITGNPFGKKLGSYQKVFCDTPYFKLIDGGLVSADRTLYVANIYSKKRTINIPDGVKIIGRGAINDCNEVELIILPQSVFALAESAISMCKNLKAIVFDCKVCIIESTALDKCENLNAIFVPMGLKDFYCSILPQQYSKFVYELDDERRSEEDILRDIFILEDKEKSISEKSKTSCISKTSKEDLDFIKSIKEDYALSTVTKEEWNQKVIDWGEYENEEHDEWDEGEASYSNDGKKFLFFEDNSETYAIKNGAEILCDGSFYNSYNYKQIILPNTIQTLGNFVFYQTDIGDFTIPASVKKITGNPFISCDVNITCNSSEFCVLNGILFDKNKTMVISVIKDDNRIVDETPMTLPSSVKAIGRYSFYEISNSGPVKLPPEVIFIGEYAFSNTIISDIILNNKIVEIGNFAFANSCLNKLELPDSCVTIGESAFSNNDNLYYIKLSASLQIIEKNTFRNCKKLNHVSIPEGVKIIKKDAFWGNSSLRDIYLPNSLEKIEEGAFIFCGFNTIVVPRRTYIEKGAFSENCKIIRREIEEIHVV